MLYHNHSMSGLCITRCRAYSADDVATMVGRHDTRHCTSFAQGSQCHLNGAGSLKHAVEEYISVELGYMWPSSSNASSCLSLTCLPCSTHPLGTPNSTPFKACTTRYVLMPFQLDLFPLRCRSLSLLRFYCLVSVYAMSTNPAAALRSFATLV